MAGLHLVQRLGCCMICGLPVTVRVSEDIIVKTRHLETARQSPATLKHELELLELSIGFECFTMRSNARNFVADTRVVVMIEAKSLVDVFASIKLTVHQWKSKGFCIDELALAQLSFVS